MTPLEPIQFVTRPLGDMKLSEAMPLLKRVARLTGLKLKYAADFRLAVQILNDQINQN